jgi:hypothetical protein
MRAAQFLAIIGRGSKGSNALENTEDRAGATSEQQDNVINTVNSLDPYGPSWQLVPGNVAADTVYAQVPNSGTGDLAFTRGSTKTRTNAAGTVVDVASGVAAIDYRNADGSLSSTGRLLPEPQRTNLVLWSEQFDNAAWTLNALEVSVTANNTLSPANTSTADLIIASAVLSSHRLQQRTINVVSGTTYSFSFYLKKKDYRFFEAQLLVQFPSGADTPTVRADLDNGTISVSGLNTSGSIVNAGNGWYRVSLTSVANATGATRLSLFLINDAGEISFAGDGLKGNWLWGAQMEVGSYPTTYIPTTTAAVTRLADFASKTGVSSLIGQTEGTMFVEVNTAVLGTVFPSAFRRLFTLSDNSITNRIIIVQNNSDDSITFTVTNGGAAQVSINTAANQSGIKKIAAAYANNDFVLYVNGVQIGTDTSGTVPACSRLAIGYETTSNLSNPACPIAQAAIFTRRLTNAELAAITTL